MSARSWTVVTIGGSTDGRADAATDGGLRVAVLAAILMLLLTVGACSSDPGYGGRSAGEWMTQLETAPDSLQRRQAADALGRILGIRPGSERVTAALVRALADTSDEVRLAAGTALVQDRRLPAVAIPGLLEALRDSAHLHTREHAAELLASVAPTEASRVVPALTRALQDPDRRVREAAARALARLRGAGSAGDSALRR